MPNAQDLQQLEATCRAFLEGGGANLQWSWDDCFKAALAAFATTTGGDVHQTLARTLLHGWNAGEIGAAPKRAQSLVEELGGLRTGQEIFVFNPEEEVILFATWWPWGGSEKVSLRIGLIGSADREAELCTAVRDWFGV